jgi:hypothetical protein
MNALLKDCVQALIIYLVFAYTLPGAEKLSADPEFIASADSFLGSLGVGVVKSLKFTAPFLLAGLTKSILRRMETLAGQQQ